MLEGNAVPPLGLGAVDKEGLVKFLVEEKRFEEGAVRRELEEVEHARREPIQGQG